jgi:hypothetical protein
MFVVADENRSNQMADDTSNNTVNNPEVIFREHFSHLGRLIDIQYKMPPFFATVIGGLWFFATQHLNKPISAAVFLFAAATSLAFLAAVHRLKLVTRGYIGSTEKLAGGHKPEIEQSCISVPVTLMIMLGIAFVISVAGFGYALCPGISS